MNEFDIVRGIVIAVATVTALILVGNVGMTVLTLLGLA